MRVTIATLADFIATIDVSPEMELENFKALCESEVGIPSQEIVVTYEGRPLLDDKRDLKGFGINEGDVLLLQQFSRQPISESSNNPVSEPGNNPISQSSNNPLPDLGIDFSAIKVPGAMQSSRPVATVTSHGPTSSSSSRPASSEDPEYFRQYLIQNPDNLIYLKQNNPRLAEAFQTGDKNKFREVMTNQLKEKADRERKRIQMLNSDPFDAEAQKMIAEEIRMDNVDSNMEAAIEYHPESFGQVTMLYINCRVNGHPVKAFIDSGAQTTIMSEACAERCAIMRLVDRRWAGIAKGVGIQKIIGRVHLGQIQIGDDFLTSSFSILEDQPMDMLLGLDMLRRHQCCIDLKRNVLVIGTTGTETPFLTEGEIPIEQSNAEKLPHFMN